MQYYTDKSRLYDRKQRGKHREDIVDSPSYLYSSHGYLGRDFCNLKEIRELLFLVLSQSRGMQGEIRG